MMTLIHTALLSEAQSIIEKYKLKKINSNPKIYSYENTIVVISGVGEKNTFNALEYVFQHFKISKAINIGIVGCNDKEINIGDLFCTNRQLDNINSIILETVDEVQLTNEISQSRVYDMEGKYFNKLVLKYIDEKDIYIFKVVSDYLDDTIPSKELTKQLIRNSLKKIEKYIC